MVGGNILTVGLEAVLIETQYIVLIPREKICFLNYTFHLILNKIWIGSQSNSQVHRTTDTEIK